MLHNLFICSFRQVTYRIGLYHLHTWRPVFLGRVKASFGVNILVLVLGAVSQGVKPRSPFNTYNHTYTNFRFMFTSETNRGLYSRPEFIVYFVPYLVCITYDYQHPSLIILPDGNHTRSALHAPNYFFHR